ncbi:uncharacterized protein [Ptychodera flava]|uniref:uncharacterized protein n=1 Tax=Ptychodera flava TaxID=63121 RepID=UPI00396A729B
MAVAPTSMKYLGERCDWPLQSHASTLTAVQSSLTRAERGLQNSRCVTKRFKSSVPNKPHVAKMGKISNNSAKDSLTGLKSHSKVKVHTKKSNFEKSKSQPRCQSAGKKTKRRKEHVARESIPQETSTQQCESVIHLRKSELKKICSTLHDILKGLGKIYEEFNEIILTNINRTWSIPSNEHTLKFIIHPGNQDTLDEIELTFKTDYVDVNFHMVGYLERLGSDNFLMVDDAGNVYRAAGDILYVVGKNLFRYLTTGPVDLGHYDYYRRLTSEVSLECIGWTECKNEESTRTNENTCKETDNSSYNDREFEEFKINCEKFHRLLDRDEVENAS